jgi:hypothetical protein
MLAFSPKIGRFLSFYDAMAGAFAQAAGRACVKRN